LLLVAVGHRKNTHALKDHRRRFRPHGNDVALHRAQATRLSLLAHDRRAISPLVGGQVLGLVVANSISGALRGFPERAGAVSAFVGVIQYGSGSVGTALLGLFADGTPWPLRLIIAAASVVSFLCTRLITPKSGPD
jgi:hypothetical protein